MNLEKNETAKENDPVNNDDANNNNDANDNVDSSADQSNQSENKQTLLNLKNDQDSKIKSNDGELAKKTDESYDIKLGNDSLLDKNHVDSVISFAKENNLTNEQANDLVKRDESLLTNYKERIISEHKNVTDQWASMSKADKEIGGENLNKNISLARSAINRFGSDGFKDYLESTGVGNHPEVIRLFSKIGKAMADDSFDIAKPKSQEKTLAERLYPDLIK
jgi:hypothetical protein